MFHQASFPVLLVSSLALAQPALAQSFTAKDAWDVLASFIDGTGGSLTSAELVRDGDSLIAQSARLDAGEWLTMQFDEIRLEPRGGQVAVIPSARFDVVSTIGAPGERRDYVVSHDGFFMLTADTNRADLELAFGQFAVVKTAATRHGQPLDEALETSYAGLTGRMGMTLDEPYELRVDLSAAEVVQSFRLNDPTMGLEQEGQSTSGDLRLALSVDGMREFDTNQPGWLRAAFEGGLAMRLESSTGAGDLRLNQTVTGMRSVVGMEVESSDGSLEVEDGAFSMDIGLHGLGLDMDFMGVPVTGTMSRIRMGFEMPLVMLPEDRPFRIALDLGETRVDGPVLAMIGAQDFAGEALSAAIDLRANGRWLVELSEDPDAADIPFDFSSFDLNRLMLGLGGSALSGEGSFNLAPGALAAMVGDFPEGEGDFAFDLRGGNALLGRLTAAGLLPADQQFMAQMMMNALGQPVGEDHLRSEVTIRPGGQLTVNGMPLPF